MACSYGGSQFLRQVEKLLTESTLTTRPESQEQHIPFLFFIPRYLVSARSDVDPLFLRLCSTTRIGPFYGDFISHKTYGRPIISYLLKVVVECSVPGKARRMRTLAEREVNIVSTNIADPPIQIEDLPGEYRLASAVAVKHHRLGRKKGRLRISAVEPPPVNLLSQDPLVCTLATVRISVTPSKALQFTVAPYNWTCILKSTLKSRTFSSTRKLTEVPTVTAATVLPFLCLSEESMLLGERQYGCLPWRQDHLSNEGTIAGQVDVLPWVTTLQSHVSIPKNSVATFMNSISARRYSLVLQVSILELRHNSVSVEVPLQLVRDPTATEGQSDLRFLGNVDATVNQIDEDATLEDLVIDLDDNGEGSHCATNRASPPVYSPEL